MAAAAKGPGERFLDCPGYENCLSFAGIQNWRSFNCEACSTFKARLKVIKTASEKENTRLCEDCREKFTISPKHRYCRSCLGKLGRKKQLEKGLSAGEAKKSQNKPIGAFTIGIQITIPKELVHLIFPSK